MALTAVQRQLVVRAVVEKLQTNPAPLADWSDLLFLTRANQVAYMTQAVTELRARRVAAHDAAPAAAVAAADAATADITQIDAALPQLT